MYEVRFSLLDLINTHRRMRPLMQLQDIYKLLYQAHLGIGHLVTDTERALAGIVREMDEASGLPIGCSLGNYLSK